MEASRKLKAGAFSGTMITKKGKKTKATITMAPFAYKGEVFVAHFLT